MIININDFDYRQYFKTHKPNVLPRPRGNNGGQRDVYIDALWTFDIETTNLVDIENSFMYIWQLQIDKDITLIGRYWYEFTNFLRDVKRYILMKIPARFYERARLVIYVHNLSFEFQFLKGIYHFTNDDVFALNTRKVAKCYMFQFFEFRCSYIHSNLSLEMYLKKMNVEHLKGHYDYSILRTPKTVLSPSELEYCVNDVRGLREAILVDMAIENDNLYSFPLTSTGYVRRDVRKALRYLKKGYIKSLLPDTDLYLLLKQAFRGGDTHASRFYSYKTLTNLKSYDRASSYPDVICNCQYPVKPFRQELHQLNMERYNALIKSGKAVIMRVILKDVKIKPSRPFPYISIGKVNNYKTNKNKPYNDNGRLLQAEWVDISITDIDFELINQDYTYTDITIIKLYSSSYGRLPQVLIDCVLDYFYKKTELKGAEDDYNKNLYAKSKEKLNSIYGMMAQDPAINDIKLINNILEEIINTVPSDKAILPYQWGVWTTAHARRELRRGVDCVEYPVYCDTDSVKYIGKDNFKQLNKEYRQRSKKNKAFTKKNGKYFYLGVYELDGEYQEFRTLGAKKYAYRDSDGLHITIAGVPKKAAHELNDDINNFDDGFIFYDGCKTIKYNDNCNFNIKIGDELINITDNVFISEGSYTVGKTIDYDRVLEHVLKEYIAYNKEVKNESN